MNKRQAIAALERIDANDPEMAHGEADKVLLEMVPEDVRKAYFDVVARAPWWASA